MSTRFTKDDLDRLQRNGLKVVGLDSDAPFKTETPLTGKERHQALGRMKSGKMNKTEERYATEVLDVRKLAGEVKEYWFEPMSLRLAEGCFYRIDFLVLMTTGVLEVHEVKGGYMTDDALVKIKVAAEKFPFVFRMMIYEKKVWRERLF